MSINNNSTIFVSGHRGMVGSSILNKLEKLNFSSILTEQRKNLDLTNQPEVFEYFKKNKPDCVIMAAAKVGGINANNKFRAEFIYENILIQSNLIHTSHLFGVKKLIFLGSSCIYPKNCAQPMKEEFLLGGPLEPTNEPYAIAKISGIKMCESYYRQYNRNFISLMPTNLYGPNDNYDLNTSHVLPALIRKFYNAKLKESKTVEIWGTGKPLREFLHVDDLADAVIFALLNVESKFLYDHLKISHLNIGSGEEISIKDLAFLIMKTMNLNLKIFFNKEMPDGTPRKLLDVSRINKLGWKKNISLKQGIKMTIDDYISENFS